MRGPFENEERQRAIVLIVMVIEGKLWLAMGGIIGVIEIEHEGRRGLWVAGNKMIHQGGGETGEVFAVHLVFKTREGGRTRQVVLRVQGTPLDSQCEQGVMTETVGVIPVCIAR